MRRPLADKHFERGRQLELQGQRVEALKAYRRACDIGPDFATPYIALGRLEAMEGRLDHAVTALDEALGMGFDAEALEWRAYVLGCMHRHQAALADYHALIDADLGSPVVHLNAARMLVALGRYDEAEAHLGPWPEAAPIRDALDRYREFPGCLKLTGEGEDPNDDQRAARYLFARALIIGTLGDGGQPLAHCRYMLLTPRHVAITLLRLRALARARGWRFDAVAGGGPHHGPLAIAAGHLLDCPVIQRPEDRPGDQVLLVSGVLSGVKAAQAVEAPWRLAGAKALHFAMGFVPDEAPNPREPALIGMVGRCAVEWYRTADYARLIPDGESGSGSWPGFTVGPAFIDPNSQRVSEALIAACRAEPRDPFARLALDYYLVRHQQVRAFTWPEERE